MEGLKLGDEWSPVRFVKNEKGETVMRFTIDDEHGNTATIDVQPNGQREVVDDGNAKAK